MKQYLLALFIVFLFEACTTQNFADLILLNGKVVTVDTNLPQAEAVAVSKDMILKVGNNDEIKRLAGPKTRIMDLEEHLTIPGLIDGHAHFMSLGYAKMNLELAGAKNWNDIVNRVADAVKQTKPGIWIIGRGWHQEKWQEIPGEHVEGYPVHDLLSRVAPNNPVYLTHASGHAIVTNNAAMKLAGITKETPDPPGGTILRKPNSEPSGVFLENADNLIYSHYRQYLQDQPDSVKKINEIKAFELAVAACLQNGITGFHDAGASFAEIDFFKQMVDQNKLSIRLWVMIGADNNQIHAHMPGYRLINYGDHRLTVRAIKRFMDGALGAHGAWLLEPYTDLPASTGLNTIDLNTLRETAGIAIENDLQLCTHAIGDRGNRETLDIYESVFRQHPDQKDLRWRIEHAQHLHPDDVPRFARLGVVAAMQSVHATSDGPWVPKRLGPERSKQGAYIWRSLLESGAIIANGTDAPVEDINPFANFYAAVTRNLTHGGSFYPEQCMTREEALQSYTFDAAYAAFEEDIKGSITAGKLADIVVLSQDILTIPVEKIPQTEILYTIVGGKILYTQSMP